MNPNGVRWRWRLVAALALLAAAVGAIASWTLAAPPSPQQLLDGLRDQHGIEFARKRGDGEWDYDKIATEWGWLVMTRKSLPPDATPTSLPIGGWRCSLQSQAKVSAEAMILGSGTIASASGSTMSRKLPDGTFDCELGTRLEDGPATFLLVAVPTGAFERLRYRAP